MHTTTATKLLVKVLYRPQGFSGIDSRGLQSHGLEGTLV